MRTLFLLVHTSTFNISLRALTLIQQIAASFPSNAPVVSRYYRALYATLLDSRLHTTRNQALFLNLLFKSLKGDPEKARVMAFVKRFCQVLASGFGGSEFVAGGLWLLGEVCVAAAQPALLEEEQLTRGDTSYSAHHQVCAHLLLKPQHQSPRVKDMTRINASRYMPTRSRLRFGSWCVAIAVDVRLLIMRVDHASPSRAPHNCSSCATATL
jgi:hypothetical protein